MKVKLAVFTLVAAFLWIASSSGQDVRPVPGPGTGIVIVKGTVDIGNTPLVTATQAGDWKVVLANTPDVRVASPEFLVVGRRYRVTWVPGQSEDVVVSQLGAGGWARVETANALRRWINLGEAQAVEELAAGR